MPHETEILFNEPGIQYQGVNDASGSTGAYPVQGLIVGQFKRGRLDKPMTIHRDNIKAMLGYEPKNPCYTAVQDVLGTGVPNVQVLRIRGGGGVISCAGAVPYATLWINGQSAAYTDVHINLVVEGESLDFSGQFYDVAHQIRELSSGQIDFYTGCGGEVEVNNYGPVDCRVTVTCLYKDFNIGGSNNPTLMIDQAEKTFKFCLAGQAVVDEPDAPSGFRIRLLVNADKSPELHKYQPWAVGTNGERVINLANLFDYPALKNNGKSEWSRIVTWDDVNFVNSNGGVTLVFNASESPNYWMDMDGVYTLTDFFEKVIREIGACLEYSDA